MTNLNTQEVPLIEKTLEVCGSKEAVVNFITMEYRSDCHCRRGLVARWGKRKPVKKNEERHGEMFVQSTNRGDG